MIIASTINQISTISYFFAVVGIAGASYGFIRYKNYTTTVKLQDDNIKALEQRSELQEKTIKANEAHIKALEARIEIVESLPLKTILEELKKINLVQNKILERLMEK
jgi:hypothetical protein